jgi:hypothetical protein
MSRYRIFKKNVVMTTETAGSGSTTPRAEVSYGDVIHL